MKGSKSFAIGSVLIMLMFAIWGLSHRLYETVFPSFVSALSLTEMQVTITHWVRSLGYVVVAIPSAIFLRNFGYKAGVIGGLGCFAIAMFMFYPAELQHSYLFFVVAGLLANCGVALLEIAADPWVMRIGPKESAVRRLNIAQTLNPLGLLVGMGMGQWLLTSAAPAHALQPYIVVGIGVLLFTYLIDKVPFSPVATERAAHGDSFRDEIRLLVGKPAFRIGLAALAIYIAGQTVLWGFAARFSAARLPGMVIDILPWTLYAFIAGRVIGTAMMYRFTPRTLLVFFSASAAVFAAAAMFAPGWYGIVFIVASSFFMSILFPTIFGLAVQDLGQETKTASALLIMASGSANLILPTVVLFAGSGYSPAFLMWPSLCFAAIAVFAATSRVIIPVAAAN